MEQETKRKKWYRRSKEEIIADQAKNAEKLELKGKITKIFYSKPDFTTGLLLEDTTFKKVKFSGKVFLKENDSIIAKGKYVNHKTYGEGFSIDSFSYNQQLTVSGLADYLVSCKIVGLGRIRADKIAKTFNSTFEEVLLKTPEKIAALVGIDLDLIEGLKKDWENRRDHAKIFTRLSATGITPGACNKLIGIYGSSIINILETDPYSLIGQVEGFGFKKIDQIARGIGIKKESPGRIKACLLYLLGENEDKGHSWIDRKQLIDQANRDLIIDTLNAKELIAKEIDGLEQTKKVKLYRRVYDNDTIAILSTYLDEISILNKFAESSHNNVFKDIPKEQIEELLKNPPFSLSNDEQWRALELFISTNLMLISGIAGSGKSFSLSLITKICQHFNIPFILLAPTGKASKRLQQFTGIEAFTIHRACGYNGSNFSKPIPELMNASVIIVDELSMVTIPLLATLLNNINLKDKSIVLAGDHRQLPCIGVGNILKDILDKQLIPNVILNKCVRQAGILRENCNKILEGSVVPTTEEFIGTSNLKPWYKILSFKTDQEIRGYIEEIYRNSLQEKLNLDIIKDVQLLTPTHKGCLGTIELNLVIQKIIQKKLYNIEVEENKERFYLGDKIMCHKNNYNLNVMNGSVGVITKYNKFDDLSVTYDGIEVHYDEKSVKDLKLGFCNTIHKTQGDEYPFVMVIVHKSHSYQHNQNLLYTAATRARKSCCLIGDQWAFTNASHKVDANLRNTFLSIL